MGEKMEFGFGTLYFHDDHEIYPISKETVTEVAVTEVMDTIMDMYANLVINGRRVRGNVKQVELHTDPTFPYLHPVKDVYLKVDGFDANPEVEKVIYNDPATIIFWTDGTKTVVKCQEGDTYSKEIGFKTAYLKKMLGNDNTFNKEINEWVPKEEPSNRVAESYTHDDERDVYIFRDNLGNTILELPRELTPTMRYVN